LTPSETWAPPARARRTIPLTDKPSFTPPAAPLCADLQVLASSRAYGQVLLVSAEPGIGKSRLAAALLERIGTEPCIRVRYLCSPHHTDSAFYPIIQRLERAAGFERHDDSATKLDGDPSNRGGRRQGSVVRCIYQNLANYRGRRPISRALSVALSKYEFRTSTQSESDAS
jgi:hypothetical protein